MSYNILLADDDENVLEHYIDIIGELDSYCTESLKPFSTRNGKEVLSFLQKSQPKAIFLDLIMPEMGGMEVLNRIGRSFEGGIYVVSGQISSDDFNLCRRKGAADIIYKPFVYTDIANCMSKAGFVIDGAYKASGSF